MVLPNRLAMDSSSTLEVKDLCKAYGDKVLMKDFTYIFLKNDRAGIIGPNGSGKSTLMKMLAGWVEPDSGTIQIGQTVKLSLIHISRG